MITLLAALTGFLSSILPQFLKLYKDKTDKQHELAILDRQIKHTKQNEQRQLEEIHISRDLLEQASLYSTYKSGISWVDGLNATVRPVLAYSFFLMYGGVKFIQYEAIAAKFHTFEYISILWNLDDQAIFAGIISFYFGQRTFNKLWQHKI